MAEIIIMPKLGFNMSEGKLVKWYKKEGDSVKKGEPVFAIETDKTSIDIEGTQDGIFRKKFIEEGDTIEVTLPIAIVAELDENIDSLIEDINKQLHGDDAPIEATPVVDKNEPSTQEGHASVSEQGASSIEKATTRLRITPRGRKAAQDAGLSLEDLNIQGTGYQGGISEKDIMNYLESNKVKATPVALKMAEAQGISLEDITGSGPNSKIMKADILGVKSTDAELIAATEALTTGEITPDGKEIMEEIPYTGVRKIIGDKLAESKFTAPHLYFTQKVNLEKLMDLRTQVNSAQEKKTSVTDFIGRAVIRTLQKYPDMNASLIGDKIIKYKSVNLGIAVAAPTGLIVPVIKNANNKTIVELSNEASALFDKARNGKLTPNEYTGGTFSISNLGMFGIENFTAIINPPESGILAVSATKDEPVVIKDSNGNKTIEIKPMMNITLTVDHRLIDGLLAAQFVTEVKRQLENPIELLV